MTYLYVWDLVAAQSNDRPTEADLREVAIGKLNIFHIGVGIAYYSEGKWHPVPKAVVKDGSHVAS